MGTLQDPIDVMRLHALTATIENGFDFLPDAPRSPVTAELTTFPAGRHDDMWRKGG